MAMGHISKPVGTSTPENGRMVNLMGKGPLLLPRPVINTLVNLEIKNTTVTGPLPRPMVINTSVGIGLENGTGRVPLPLLMVG